MSRENQHDYKLGTMALRILSHVPSLKDGTELRNNFNL